MANDTPFGLGGYVDSRNISGVWRTAEALDFGIVGCTTGPISTEVATFGGMKESGPGREGASRGVEEHPEVKHLCLAV